MASAEKLEAHRLLAIASIARGETARAEASFRTVLSIDPAFELEAGTSPKISSVLARVKAELSRAPKIVDLEATPQTKRVHFLARVQDPDARLVSIELYTRTAGDRFDQIRMEREGDQLSAGVPVPDRESLVRLEYFLVGRDAEGEAIARIGDASQPSSVIVKRTIERTPSPPLVPLAPADSVNTTSEWYEHWWVWAIAAGVVGASVTTAVVLSNGGDEPPGGTLDPIRPR